MVYSSELMEPRVRREVRDEGPTVRRSEMSRVLKCGGALAVVGLLVSMNAEAGQALTSAGCNKAADGSGSCFGNFQSFRNHSDAATYVSFIEYASGSRYFQAWWPTTGVVSCVPSATVANVWPRVMLHEGYFYLTWDTTGTCTTLILNNGSQHSSF
jgi:hypothetical protein